jgi:ribosome-binding protein aMBF1 (putative translation factor)
LFCAKREEREGKGGGNYYCDYCPLYFCLQENKLSTMKNNEQKLLNQLAHKIKKRRTELNISQEKLAQKCNFDRTYISLLERAKRNPSYLSLLKLCIGLEIELIELLKEEEDAQQ